jgi:hypothetical protein
LNKITNDGIKNYDNNKGRLDVLDRLFIIAEDTLFYKANDIEEDLMFLRKVTLRLLKNQKNCLNLTIE